MIPHSILLNCANTYLVHFGLDLGTSSSNPLGKLEKMYRCALQRAWLCTAKVLAGTFGSLNMSSSGDLPFFISFRIFIVGNSWDRSPIAVIRKMHGKNSVPISILQMEHSDLKTFKKFHTGFLN